MEESTQAPTSRSWLGWLVFGGCLAGVFALGLLFASILERRSEATKLGPLIAIGDLESNNAAWAVNWPREYDSYRQMQDANGPTRTMFGGSYQRDYLAETPANVVLFAGYAFSKDFKQARGHWNAVDDVRASDRLVRMPTTNAKATVATCWTCKSPDVPRMMATLAVENGKAKAEDSLQARVLAGAGLFYQEKLTHWEGQIKHPIGCLDCHDPKTMALRISRPGLIEAFQRQGKDVTAVSHQEMRTLVCAQCHVEYYFRDRQDGKGNVYLTFPWDKGTTIEAIEAYYNEQVPDFSDWTHAISGTPMIKMQHPDYEVYKSGIHAYRGVACADCHMPYRTEGGAKFTSHHVQSPLLDVSTSCVVCHRWSESEIRGRVEAIQVKTQETRTLAEAALTQAHFDIAACMQAGATPEELKPLRAKVRSSQIRWDYVAANNGMGFHAPQECVRILAAAVNLAQQCRVEAAQVLARHGVTGNVVYPDTSSKEKAQELIKQFNWKENKAPKLLPVASART